MLDEIKYLKKVFVNSQFYQSNSALLMHSTYSVGIEEDKIN